ncbi:hypothetical protein DFH09DRAFT_1083469 [Mycena vulgaris]|nr:hypothetical protein DFH09DRAFT_1083469 [Mycena vulgaris]
MMRASCTWINVRSGCVGNYLATENQDLLKEAVGYSVLHGHIQQARVGIKSTVPHPVAENEAGVVCATFEIASLPTIDERFRSHGSAGRTRQSGKRRAPRRGPPTLARKIIKVLNWLACTVKDWQSWYNCPDGSCPGDVLPPRRLSRSWIHTVDPERNRFSQLALLLANTHINLATLSPTVQALIAQAEQRYPRSIAAHDGPVWEYTAPRDVGGGSVVISLYSIILHRE